jgi:glycosyltransferase involved in cell wall biosynthesis
MFVATSLPVGGAETLLANLVRRMDRERFAPQICCLKEPGPIGKSLAGEFPVHARLLANRWDVRVFFRLSQLIAQQRIDALVTVGAGDKMFWGRLAAWWKHLPVVCSAIHSTGWPDSIGYLNRQLTGITDAFIAVALPHARHLVEQEGFPAEKVRVVPNGVDTHRFQPSTDGGKGVRKQLGIPESAPVIGTVAALRPEKNQQLFLRAAASVKSRHPAARFLIVGDGPERIRLEQVAQSLEIAADVHFLGTRADVPHVLAAMDVFVLTSHNEANPVSILEALACKVPVVATRVGSVPETVIPGQTGFLVAPGSLDEISYRLDQLISDPGLRRQLGVAGREMVEAHASLERMVEGYERLLVEVYSSKCQQDRPRGDSARLPARVGGP